MRLTVASPARFCRIGSGGQDWPINTSQIKVGLENVKATPTADGGCTISGTLKLRLPQNSSVTGEFSGQVTTGNKLTASLNGTTNIDIASLELEWGGTFTLDESLGLEIPLSTWKMPAGWAASRKESMVRCGSAATASRSMARDPFDVGLQLGRHEIQDQHRFGEAGI